MGLYERNKWSGIHLIIKWPYKTQSFENNLVWPCTLWQLFVDLRSRLLDLYYLEVQIGGPLQLSNKNRTFLLRFETNSTTDSLGIQVFFPGTVATTFPLDKKCGTCQEGQTKRPNAVIPTRPAASGLCITGKHVGTLAVCSLNIFPYAIYNPYIVGTWWYKFRVLLQGYPHFPYECSYDTCFDLYLAVSGYPRGSNYYLFRRQYKTL